jgi:hypothetical protein
MLDEYKKRAGSVFGVFGESPNEPKSRIEANKERTTNAAGSHFWPGLKKGLYLCAGISGGGSPGDINFFIGAQRREILGLFARFVGFRRVAAKSASKKLSPSTTTGPETPV